MNITFRLILFGRRIATFGVRIDIDHDTAAAAQPAVNGAVKRVSRRWPPG